MRLDVDWELWADRVFVGEEDRATLIYFEDILQIRWPEVPGDPDVRTMCDQPVMVPVHNLVFVLRNGKCVVFADQSYEQFRTVRSTWGAWWRR